MANKYLDELKQDENWIAPQERSNIPSVINGKYELLKKMVDSEDLFGAMFVLRDFYEISMKVPAIMGLIIVSTNYERENSFRDKTEQQLEELCNRHEESIGGSRRKSKKVAQGNKAIVQENFSRILARMIKEPLAMGSWQELLNILKKRGEILGLSKTLRSIIEKTSKALDYSFCGYDNVISWRNNTIGHGMLMVGNEEKNYDRYWKEVSELVCGINSLYYSAKIELNNLYSEVFFFSQNEKMCGNHFLTGKEEIILSDEGKEYKVTEFVYPGEDSYLFFDSYYSKIGLTKVIDYSENSMFLEEDDSKKHYYQDLYLLYVVFAKSNQGEKVIEKEIGDSADRRMLTCIHETSVFRMPYFIVSELKELIDDLDKGVILLQAERGMGKSALSHKLDSRYEKKIWQGELSSKDSPIILRTYHINEANIKGEVDFYESIHRNFIETGDEENLELNIPEIHQLLLDLTKEKRKPKESFSRLLDIYRDTYERYYGADNVRLVYIIDGIDEISGELQPILDCIPTYEELAEGTFIVLTSRFEDEDKMSQSAIDSIKYVKGLLSQDEPELIELRSDDERYLALLQEYIDNLTEKDYSVAEKREIINHAKRKFLYIRPYLIFKDAIFSDDAIVEPALVAEKYIKELKKMYYGNSRDTLDLIICALALIGGASLEEICDLVLFSGVSYDGIGGINDLQPLLTVRRYENTNIYEYANDEYREYILSSDDFSVAIRNVVKRMRVSFAHYLSKKELIGKGRFFDILFTISNMINKYALHEYFYNVQMLNVLNEVQTFPQYVSFPENIKHQYQHFLIQAFEYARDYNIRAMYMEPQVLDLITEKEWKAFFEETIFCCKYSLNNYEAAFDMLIHARTLSEARHFGQNIEEGYIFGDLYGMPNKVLGFRDPGYVIEELYSIDGNDDSKGAERFEAYIKCKALEEILLTEKDTSYDLYLEYIVSISAYCSINLEFLTILLAIYQHTITICDLEPNVAMAYRNKIQYFIYFLKRDNLHMDEKYKELVSIDILEHYFSIDDIINRITLAISRNDFKRVYQLVEVFEIIELNGEERNKVEQIKKQIATRTIEYFEGELDENIFNAIPSYDAFTSLYCAGNDEEKYIVKWREILKKICSYISGEIKSYSKDEYRKLYILCRIIISDGNFDDNTKDYLFYIAGTYYGLHLNGWNTVDIDMPVFSIECDANSPYYGEIIREFDNNYEHLPRLLFYQYIDHGRNYPIMDYMYYMDVRRRNYSFDYLPLTELIIKAELVIHDAREIIEECAEKIVRISDFEAQRKIEIILKKNCELFRDYPELLGRISGKEVMYYHMILSEIRDKVSNESVQQWVDALDRDFEVTSFIKENMEETMQQFSSCLPSKLFDIKSGEFIDNKKFKKMKALIANFSLD